MDCNKAGLLMMKYMDKALPEHDMNLLSRHLEGCAACKEDFSLYNDLMSGFSEIEIINAPDDIEAKVMARINELSPAQNKHYATDKSAIAFDNLAYICFGAFSMLIGINFVFSLYKDSIIEYMYASPNLGILADFFVALSDYAARFSVTLTQIMGSFMASFSDYFSYARYVLISVFVVLGIVQYVIHKKDKVEA